jgi:hypothetical protein
MQDIAERAEYYRLRGHRKARSHYLTAKRASRMHTWLGVPVVVFSTIVGSTIFATLSSSPSAGWKIGAGLLSLSSAVLASLQTFFKYSELAEKHRTSGAQYASIKRRLDAFQLRTAEADGSREESLQALEAIVAALDQLERESPDVPDDLYDRAVNEQQSDAEGI